MEIITKLLEPLAVVPLYKKTIIQITIPNEMRGDAVRLLSNEAHDPDQLYAVRIEKARKRRSLDANAYAWALIGKLAVKLNLPAVDVYRRIIADGGAYTIIPIKEEAVRSWTELWQGRGTGWLCEDLGACRNTPGYRNLKCWHGSSAYTTDEMNYFISLVKQECDEQGIETMTPKELEELVMAWRE